MGDFNLHLESSSSDVRQLTGILESFDLNQLVNFPTHWELTATEQISFYVSNRAFGC